MRRKKTWTSLRSTWSSFHQGLQCTTSLLQYLLCTSSMRGTWSSFHQGQQYTSLLLLAVHIFTERYLVQLSSGSAMYQSTTVLAVHIFTEMYLVQLPSRIAKYQSTTVNSTPCTQSSSMRGSWSSSHQGLQCTSLLQYLLYTSSLRLVRGSCSSFHQGLQCTSLLQSLTLLYTITQKCLKCKKLGGSFL